MKYLIFVIAIGFFLTGCHSEKTSGDSLIPIQVTLETKAHSIKAEEPVKLKVKVTQGKENVEDAYEVMFEVWKVGSDEHEMKKATHEKEGVYSVDEIFPEAGTYYVVTHTTARDVHVMPKNEIQVEE